MPKPSVFGDGVLHAQMLGIVLRLSNAVCSAQRSGVSGWSALVGLSLLYCHPRACRCSPCIRRLPVVHLSESATAIAGSARGVGRPSSPATFNQSGPERLGCRQTIQFRANVCHAACNHQASGTCGVRSPAQHFGCSWAAGSRTHRCQESLPFAAAHVCWQKRALRVGQTGRAFWRSCRWFGRKRPVPARSTLSLVLFSTMKCCNVCSPSLGNKGRCIPKFSGLSCLCLRR